MDDLIQALTIFRKYGNPKEPCYCNDEMLMMDPDVFIPSEVSAEDKARLEELGFDVFEKLDIAGDRDAFASYRFGNC